MMFLTYAEHRLVTQLCTAYFVACEPTLMMTLAGQWLFPAVSM